MTNRNISSSEIIAYNIKKIMMTKGLSFAQLLEKAGVSSAYANLIRKPEKFNPTIQILEKFCDVLGVTLKQLVDPNLSVTSVNELPPGLKRYDVVLSEYQYYLISRYNDYNNQLIKNYRLQKLKNFEDLQK